MPDECDGTTIPAACVDRFDRGTQVMAQTAAKIDTIGGQVDEMHKVLLGNGDPKKGLAFRVQTLEDDEADKKKWTDRAWEIGAGVVIGVIIMLLVGGCAGLSSMPANVATPIATVAPEITAEHIDELRQDIQQVQTTIQTTNYALDGERAAVMKADLRKQEKQAAQGQAILVGFVLFMAMAPAFIPKRYAWIGYLVAISIICAAVGLPLVWPF